MPDRITDFFADLAMAVIVELFTLCMVALLVSMVGRQM